MAETKIDPDAAMEWTEIEINITGTYKTADEDMRHNQARHYKALVEAVQGLAKEIPRWIQEHGLGVVDDATGDDDDLSCVSCHQTAHEWRSIEHENGKYCHVGRITRALLTLEALLPTKED